MFSVNPALLTRIWFLSKTLAIIPYMVAAGGVLGWYAFTKLLPWFIVTLLPWWFWFPCLGPLWQHRWATSWNKGKEMATLCALKMDLSEWVTSPDWWARVWQMYAAGGLPWWSSGWLCAPALPKEAVNSLQSQRRFLLPTLKTNWHIYLHILVFK